MATYEAPGVYVEELPLIPTIAGVGTSTVGFIGVVPDGIEMPLDPTDPTGAATIPLTPAGEPVRVTSFDQYKRAFGDFQKADPGPPPVEPLNRVLAHSVFGFFNNGGSACWVARVKDLTKIAEVGPVLAKFAAIDEIALVAAPGALTEDVQTAIINHCEDVTLQDRFAIIDGQRATTVGVPEIKGSINGKPAGSSDYAAIYFPFVKVANLEPDPPKGQETIEIPPSGLMAGIYARVDNARGVHKAPANEEVRGALGLTYQTTKAEQAAVNLAGINIIRPLNGSILVWGARTLGSADNKKIAYVNVRRLLIFLRESIDEGTQFAVFEPNSKPLWEKIIRSVTGLLTRVWRDGALFGVVPEQAFYVRCDESTNPPETREIGQVIAEIGVAPVIPAEFVIFRIAQFPEIPTS